MRKLDHAHAIRVLSALRDMKQRDLAHKAGLDPSYISLILNGQRPVTNVALRKIVRALGVSMLLYRSMGKHRVPSGMETKLAHEVMRIWGWEK